MEAREGTDGRGWLTTAEVGQLLDLCTTRVIELCRESGIDERRTKGRGYRQTCIWRREQVEKLLAERQREEWMKRQGLKRCTGCRRWLDARNQFWKGQAKCILCASAEKKARWARKRAKKKTQPAPADRLEPGRRLADLLGITEEAARASGSKGYACMKEDGVSRLPIPYRSTLRQAFCAVCTADHCVYHPDMKPEQVRLLNRLPTQYPEHRMADYAEP